MIIRTILVAAAALASISFGPGHAKAAAPYCAVISLGPGNAYWDCQYYSFEDCYREIALIDVSIPIIEPLRCWVNGASFDLSNSRRIDEQNAEALWAACKFTIER